MTLLKCGQCGKGLVLFNDTYVKEHKQEENWISANCTECNKVTGIDGSCH